MRTSFLFPLTALVAVAAGCGSEVREQARSVPRRDLTLVTPTAEVKVASPIERQQLKYSPKRVRAPRSSHLQAPAKLVDVWVPKPIVAPAPLAQPVSTASTPANDHELLPGQTVTLIPASSGPSTGTDRTEELPAARGRTMTAHGGAGCRGGGRGPGVARAPRPDFR